MDITEMQDFSLAGGTALSLLYGHRKSFDLDFFGEVKFENQTVINSFNSRFGDQFKVRLTTSYGVFGFIEDLKIDVIRVQHPAIRPTITPKGIRMYAPEDIVAMKVQAIIGRGKKKDFWDISELLNHFKVEDFISLHQQKYSTQNLLISVPQVMTFFDDANDDEDPISLKNQTWDSVKMHIQQKVRKFLE
jgi:predicted nucleotidyltransferase component of viral defense system